MKFKRLPTYSEIDTVLNKWHAGRMAIWNAGRAVDTSVHLGLDRYTKLNDVVDKMLADLGGKANYKEMVGDPAIIQVSINSVYAEWRQCESTVYKHTVEAFYHLYEIMYED